MDQRCASDQQNPQTALLQLIACHGSAIMADNGTAHHSVSASWSVASYGQLQSTSLETSLETWWSLSCLSGSVGRTPVYVTELSVGTVGFQTGALPTDSSV